MYILVYNRLLLSLNELFNLRAADERYIIEKINFAHYFLNLLSDCIIELYAASMSTKKKQLAVPSVILNNGHKVPIIGLGTWKVTKYNYFIFKLQYTFFHN